MNFEEHAAKSLLSRSGIDVPRGQVCSSAAEAAAAVDEIGPAVVKAQVPAGKRGRAGGVRPVDTTAAARAAAEAILGMEIGGHTVERLLVEERADIARECYAAVLNDAQARRPLVLFSTEGGMDIEEIAAAHPGAIRRASPDVRSGFDEAAAAGMVKDLDLGAAADAVAGLLARLYRMYAERDAELVEVNPLAILGDGRVIALDCKLVLDDAALYRQQEIAGDGAPETLTALERKGRDAGLKYIELDGDVGVLANGAGLTMTTMDVIRHFGGRPANFLEIGGEAYTKAEAALDLTLSNANVKSLIINFCGAFARTDVMAEGVVAAWEKLRPDLPVFFSIHGTGDEEAIRLVRERLGIEPYEVMEDAVKAAVEAAR